MLKSTAVEVFMQHVSKDLFLWKAVNRTDTAVIVSLQLSVCSADCRLVVWWLMLMSFCFIAPFFWGGWAAVAVGPSLVLFCDHDGLKTIEYICHVLTPITFICITAPML